MGSKYLDRVDNKALGQLLIEKGALSEQQVNEALEVSRRKAIRLGEALVSLGYIGGDALSYAIAEQYGQRPMELHPSMIDEDLVRRFDWNLLWQHAMLPLIELENELVVVVGDPNDQSGLDALAKLSQGMQITPQLAATGQIQRCLESFRPPAARDQVTPEWQPASSDAPMILLPDFGQPPAPASAQFDEWILSAAAAHWGQDILVRKSGDDLIISLTPAQGNSDVDIAAPATDASALKELGRWAGRAPMDALDGLMRQCIKVCYTGGQVCRISQARQYAGSNYDFLVICPLTPGSEFARIRALRHLGHNIDPILAANPAALPAPGRCTVVEYGPLLRLDRLIQQMVAHVQSSQQVVILAAHVRTALSGAAVYPLPFADAASAAQAHAATAVLFDSPPAPGVIDRLFLATSPPPAVIIFAPSGTREAVDAITARPGTCHVRIEESLSPSGADASSESSPLENH